MSREQEPMNEQDRQEPQATAALDGPSVEELQKSLDEITVKADTYLNNWRRTQADMENLRKRTEQEKQETTLWASTSILSAILPVLDDFARALESMEPEKKKEKWIEGLNLVYKKMLTMLESQGVTLVPTVGQQFDPKFHEAVMRVDGEEGKVITELQKGYKLRDRVIRPAFVAVGNGNKKSKDKKDSED